MENIKKKTWEDGFFERIEVFLTKYGHEKSVFFREWTFFDKMWAWELWFFREKSEKKKGILLTFLAHPIM